MLENRPKGDKEKEAGGGFGVCSSKTYCGLVRGQYILWARLNTTLCVHCIYNGRHFTRLIVIDFINRESYFVYSLGQSNFFLFVNFLLLV